MIKKKAYIKKRLAEIEDQALITSKTLAIAVEDCIPLLVREFYSRWNYYPKTGELYTMIKIHLSLSNIPPILLEGVVQSMADDCTVIQKENGYIKLVDA